MSSSQRHSWSIVSVTAWMTSTPDTAVRAFELNTVNFGHLSDDKLQPSLAIALGLRAMIEFSENNAATALQITDRFLSRFAKLPDPIIGKLTAYLLSNKAGFLHELGRHAEALAAYNEMLAQGDDPLKPFPSEALSKAWMGKGAVLEELGRTREAISAYDNVSQRFGDDIDLEVRKQVLDALVRKGQSLNKLDQPDDALKAFDEAVLRFGETPEVAMRNLVASALMYKAITLWQLKREDEALEICANIVNRLNDAPESQLRFQVASALVMRGVFLHELGRDSEAIAAYEDVDRRFGEVAEPIVRAQTAQALLNRAMLLKESRGIAAEVAAYGQLVQRFGDAAEIYIQEHVAAAFNGWAFGLLCQAKASWGAPNGEANVTLKEAEKKIERALDLKPKDPVMLGNKGYILFLQGRQDEAAIALRSAIELGGDEVRQGELADAEINAIPVDEDFKALVRSVVATA